LGRFPELTPVQWAFPNPFPRAGDTHDVEVGDEVVVANVAFGWRVPSLGDLTQVLLQVGDDVFEAGDLGGMLRGAGLDREGKTVNELTELWCRHVGVCVESCEH